MSKNYIIITVSIVILLGILIGSRYVFRQSSSLIAPNKPIISASFYPMAFFAEQIAQNNFTIHTITPPGVEPHDYELTARDIGTLQQSKLLIINGSLEPWANSLTKTIGNDVQVITASKDVAEGADPHVWLSPVLAKQEVMRITKAIIAVDENNASLYQQRERTLLDKLDTLDMAYKTGLAVCQTRDIVISHLAFHYLAQQYDLQQIAITGISPDSEPSAKTLITIAQFVREHNVKYIFFESLASPKLANTLAQETNVQTLELNPLEGLSQDAIDGGQNYFTVMYNNLHNLQTALSCTT